MAYMGAIFEIRHGTLYSRAVPRASQRSPSFGLFLGLIVTLAAVAAYSWYIALQLTHLRELQANLADQYRRDSLQLLRIQNDLNSLGLAMRDMLANDEPYPLTAWSAQFQRVRDDLDDALHLESQFALAQRTPDQKKYLLTSFTQFWDAVDRVFSLARAGNSAAAREQIRVTLQARQASLTTAVARQLVENNEGERQAALQIGAIYDRVQRRLYWFLAAILAAIVFTSLYLIRANRRLFARIAALSNQRSELAQKLIGTQESTLRYISRELHDEFGQVLTAIGSLLSRTERQLPSGSAFQSDLHEVRDITEQALQNVRTLSQSLHPVMLDEAGLESTIDWYLSAFQKQTGTAVKYEKTGATLQLSSAATVNIYRILQEALNNIARHSGAKQAWVRLRYSTDALELEIEDNGIGLSPQSQRPGIGLVAMRERAELLDGSVEILYAAAGGTLIRLHVPVEKDDSNAP
jgi:signal transduction histidine kinase